MTIDEMIDNICRRFGFEAKETIGFCRTCEKTNDIKKIEKKYKKLLDK